MHHRHFLDVVVSLLTDWYQYAPQRTGTSAGIRGHQLIESLYTNRTSLVTLIPFVGFWCLSEQVILFDGNNCHPGAEFESSKNLL
jgi:hypothetical protein